MKPTRIYIRCAQAAVITIAMLLFMNAYGLYSARYGVYTVDLGVTLNPSTAAVDLTKMINAIERRLGRSP